MEKKKDSLYNNKYSDETEGLTMEQWKNLDTMKSYQEMVREKYILQYNYTDKMEFVHNR